MQSPKQILTKFGINLPPDQEEKVIRAMEYYRSEPEEEVVLSNPQNTRAVDWLRSAGRGILHS